MADRKLKDLFLRADKEMITDAQKKKQAYEAASSELFRRKAFLSSDYNMTRRGRNILLNLFRYMDKSFFAVYAILFSVGAVGMYFCEWANLNENTIIAIYMSGACILSAASIIFIDKLFFGKMAELGKSCYFGTKQCIAAYLAASGVICLALLLFFTFYINISLGVSFVRAGLYIFTPYLTSDTVAVGILSTGAGRRNPYLFAAGALSISAAYALLLLFPSLFLAAAAGIWLIAFGISAVLNVLQIWRLFNRIDKGELLCTN